MMEIPNKKALLRNLMFLQPETKEALHDWVKVYLGIDLPSSTIDPDSTSNPTDMLWECYSAMRLGSEDFTRVLAYASRDSFKTMQASILELVAVVLLERDVGHAAAIESQALVSARYCKKFFNNQYLRDFVSKQSERRVEFTRYRNSSGLIISPVEFAALNAAEKTLYTESTTCLQIVIMSMDGANSLHVPLLVEDEIDLADPLGYEEAKMIPSQTHDGKPPLTLLTSTRKFSIGLVQREIDNADESGLAIRHWNIVDVSEKCPEKRHRPDLPRIPIYYSDKELRACSAEDFQNLPTNKKESYQSIEGYQGCLDNCKIFAACKGRLADLQTGSSKMLKKIVDVQSKFRSTQTETAQAQLLCRKPSREGMIYPYLNEEIHKKTPSQIAELAGIENFPKNLTRVQLVELLKQKGCDFFVGLDHGHSHNFACAIFAVDGKNAYVVDAIIEAELELSQKIERLKEHFDYLKISPIIFPDPEEPASNKTIGKHWTVRKVDKGAGSVVSGIQTVRMKLAPTFGRSPEIYFISDGDPQLDLGFKQMARYHWKLNAAGEPTKDPEKKDDDFPDALRYGIMSVFDQSGQIVVAPVEGLPAYNSSLMVAPNPTPTLQNWMSDKIRELTGESVGNQSDENGVSNLGGGEKSKFYFGS